MAKRKDSGQICSLSFLYTYINRNCVQKPPGLKGLSLRRRILGTKRVLNCLLLLKAGGKIRHNGLHAACSLQSFVVEWAH